MVFLNVLGLVCATVLLSVPSVQGQESQSSNWKPRIDDTSKSELFEIVKEIQVLGPSSFPEPTRLFNNSKVDVIVKPAFGEHRPEQDVVMAYAEGEYLSESVFCIIFHILPCADVCMVLYGIVSYGIVQYHTTWYIELVSVL